MAIRTASARVKTRPGKAATPAKRDTAKELTYALAWMERRGSKGNRDGMARYGITAKKVFGISVADMRTLAKELGRSHSLAQSLWKTGWHEARMLAALVGEPERVTPAEMDRWAKAFDNWAVCDTLTFVLWDRTPHAWPKVREWAKHKEEFVKRASFAMLASLTVHDKAAPDERYLEGLVLIEREATDERNFVKKAVNWALRSIGKRSPMLNREAIAVAKRLAASENSTSRWVGKDALRELTSASVLQRLARRDSKVTRSKT